MKLSAIISVLIFSSLFLGMRGQAAEPEEEGLNQLIEKFNIKSDTFREFQDFDNGNCLLTVYVFQISGARVFELQMKEYDKTTEKISKKALFHLDSRLRPDKNLGESSRTKIQNSNESLQVQTANTVGEMGDEFGHQPFSVVENSVTIKSASTADSKTYDVSISYGDISMSCKGLRLKP